MTRIFADVKTNYFLLFELYQQKTKSFLIRFNPPHPRHPRSIPKFNSLKWRVKRKT